MSENGRRDFISWVLGAGFTFVSGLILYPVVRFMTPPEIAEAEISTVLAGRISEMGPGTGKAFKFGTKPGILVRTESGEFHAFIAICTHLSCIVQFSKEKNGIWCACHNGLFDYYGNVVSGPPPKPLMPLNVIIKGDEIYVARAE